MKQLAGRRGDVAFCRGHATTGPSVAGSTNILVNNRPLLRVHDAGMHELGSARRFSVVVGAPCVLANGRHAARLGDAVRHHDGPGALASGSSDVIIGDFGKDVAPRTPAKLLVTVWLNALRLPGVDLRTSTGASGRTGEDGCAVLTGLPAGSTVLYVEDQEVCRFSVIGGESIRIELRSLLPVVGCSFRGARR